MTLNFSASTMKRAYAVFLLVVGTYFLLTTRTDAGKDKVPLAAPAELPGDPERP